MPSPHPRRAIPYREPLRAHQSTPWRQLLDPYVQLSEVLGGDCAEQAKLLAAGFGLNRELIVIAAESTLPDGWPEEPGSGPPNINDRSQRLGGLITNIGAVSTVVGSDSRFKYHRKAAEEAAAALSWVVLAGSYGDSPSVHTKEHAEVPRPAQPRPASVRISPVAVP